MGFLFVTRVFGVRLNFGTFSSFQVWNRKLSVLFLYPDNGHMEIRRVKIWLVFVCSLALAVAAIVFGAETNRKRLHLATSNTHQHGRQPRENDTLPVILFWTDYFSKKFTDAPGELAGIKKTVSRCPEIRCRISSDRRELRNSAAVLFHPRDMSDVTWIPPLRSPDQYYVFYLLESPLHTRSDLRMFPPGFFSLTFTYRLDSDVVSDYYLKQYAPMVWTSENEFDRLWAQKTGLAVFFESYCAAPSMRRQIVDELRRQLRIDMYGICGFLKCSKADQRVCDQLLSGYKYYFAFENSICRDYMTEKVFWALRLGVVPVVLGGGNYTAVLPPGSFVDVFDFPNLRALAAHLLNVAGDKQLYEKYFKWRYNPQWTTLPEPFVTKKMSWCKICEMLHQKPRKRKIISSIKDWWELSGVCRAPVLFDTATFRYESQKEFDALG